MDIMKVYFFRVVLGNIIIPNSDKLIPCAI